MSHARAYRRHDPDNRDEVHIRFLVSRLSSTALQRFDEDVLNSGDVWLAGRWEMHTFTSPPEPRMNASAHGMRHRSLRIEGTMSNEPTPSGEDQSKGDRAESVRRILSDEEAPQDTEQPTGGPADESGEMAPDDVGESITRRGEDVADDDGTEAGREDTGTDGTPADRPTGASTVRDRTGIDPQEPTTGSPPQ
jgi:hypothetical protein